jgi:uncharacterized protein involved in exopolysaccharide biosynthesis
VPHPKLARTLRRRRRRGWATFLLGFVLGVLALLFTALLAAGQV